MDKILLLTMLYDFYSELLTKKQKEIFELYHLDDFSLNEISDQFGISRQAVLDSIKRTEKALLKYEEKLSLVSKYTKRKENIEKLINKLENTNSSENLINIKSELNKLLD